MACVENVCNGCFHTWFDNSLTNPCPQCGTFSVERFFDEDSDYDDVADWRNDA